MVPFITNLVGVTAMLGGGVCLLRRALGLPVAAQYYRDPSPDLGASRLSIKTPSEKPATATEKGQPSNNNKGSNKKPGFFSALTDGVRHFFENFPAPSDPDLDNRRQVYGHVANLFAEHLQCSPEEARDLAHCLCGEQDKTILADGKPCDPTLLEKARALLIQVQLQYLLPDSRQAHRITIITFQPAGQIVNHRVKETLGWDLLPREVRDERLRHGTNQLAFQVYPPCGDAVNL